VSARPLSLAVGVALLVAATPAAGHIAVGRGVAGVRLGATQHAVRRALGRPDYIRPPAWGYRRRLSGRVGFGSGGRVSFIFTTSHHQRTGRGIGPGASWRAFRRAYRRAQCFSRPAGRICLMQSHYQGRLVETDFLFGKRKLREVDIYFV
jgi:hypothetical protein